MAVKSHETGVWCWECHPMLKCHILLWFMGVESEEPNENYVVKLIANFQRNLHTYTCTYCTCSFAVLLTLSPTQYLSLLLSITNTNPLPSSGWSGWGGKYQSATDQLPDPTGRKGTLEQYSQLKAASAASELMHRQSRRTKKQTHTNIHNQWPQSPTENVFIPHRYWILNSDSSEGV